MTSNIGLLESVLDRAIRELERAEIDLFTFAFYHDQESGAISVCADTEANSLRAEAHANELRRRRFVRAILDGSLAWAGRWFASTGRNLSLGDFELVNVARTDLLDPDVSDAFYLAMIERIIEREETLCRLASRPKRLLFLCSGPSDEVGFGWAAASE